MPIDVPVNCANPDCHEPAIKAIHCSSRSVAIDAVDGAGVFARHITYRCSQCGHTWALQGYSSVDSGWPPVDERPATGSSRSEDRGWW